jgi:hypothetical protein
MSDIPEGESVLVGTFSLNGHLIVVLFDTRATQDFISKACTQRHQLAIEPTNTPYVISTPGGRVITKELVMHTPLNLAGKLFRTSLIVLDGQRIDVILGMSWMKEHKVLLDSVSCTVHLDSQQMVVVLQLSPPATKHSSVHYTTAQNPEDIHVACVFPDVFPEDLVGMSWMKGHKALLDTVSCTMSLDSPANGVVVLQLSPPATKHSSVHYTTAQNLEDICVACEFPDVFSEELPGMPPD